ncbi:hypothetical protein L1887_28935 [Cichorium endivia]|nr:hypothetical protein L1887_28935 [Cichorium endivia]
MSKARYELEEVIGKEDRTVEESDLSRLPYLQAVIKDTLRQNPPVILLIPNRAIGDVEIQVYVVPKDALIMCNFRAMGQDQTYGRTHKFSGRRGSLMSELTTKGVIFSSYRSV